MPMPKNDDKQILYNDRWVDKEHFRAFVYNAAGDQQLADSYEEYEDMITSGLWFNDKVAALEAPKARKPKDGANS